MRTIWDNDKEEINEYSVCIQKEEYWHNKRENRVEAGRDKRWCAEEGEEEEEKKDSGMEMKIRVGETKRKKDKGYGLCAR